MSLLTRLFRARRPIEPAPSAPDAADHLRAGNAHLEAGRLEDAAGCYRNAIDADPHRADGHVNLGFVLYRLGRLQEAETALDAAARIDPASHDAHYLLGLLLLARHAHEAAIVHLQRAIELSPGLLPVYPSLGKALHDVGRHDEAKKVLRQGLAIDPDDATLHSHLGNVELHLMELEEAVASYRKALALDPGLADIHSNIGQVLMNLGDFEGAVNAARAALAIDPGSHVAHSNLLMTLSCDPACPPASYRNEAAAYGRQLAALLGTQVSHRTFANATPDAPLRVGFVSADLNRHPVGYFLVGTLRHWNAASMTAIAYSNHRKHDDITAELKTHFSEWRDIADLDDGAVVGLVAADRIDVLVDLSGYTAHNRLPVFARRAAPVQASWLGYWASTGLGTMDFLLTDEVTLPPARRDEVTEEVRYLPGTRLCFTAPSGEMVPAVSPPPGTRRPQVTFGSFQRLTKITVAVLALWARVLNAVPNSRLRLQCAQMRNAVARAQVLDRLSAFGIAPDRIELLVNVPYGDYLAAHADVDIILDTFPYSGGTTTCEALWMGVPTLTLGGETMLSRQGVAMMASVGLADWVADGEDDFVRRAAAHAGDMAALAALRGRLREQAGASPLFDGARSAVNLQDAIRGMWATSVSRAHVAHAQESTVRPDETT
jgi:protein O-GlcNAc transferase